MILIEMNRLKSEKKRKKKQMQNELIKWNMNIRRKKMNC